MWKSRVNYSTWELWILWRGLRVLSPIVSCQPTILLVCFKVLSCHLQRYPDACAIITVPVCQARLCVCAIVLVEHSKLGSFSVVFKSKSCRWLRPTSNDIVFLLKAFFVDGSKQSHGRVKFSIYGNSIMFLFVPYEVCGWHNSPRRLISRRRWRCWIAIFWGLLQQTPLFSLSKSELYSPGRLQFWILLMLLASSSFSFHRSLPNTEYTMWFVILGSVVALDMTRLPLERFDAIICASKFEFLLTFPLQLFGFTSFLPS